MSTFAEKQNQCQKGVVSSPARPNLATFRPDRREHPMIRLQRAIGNQAVQRMLQTSGELVQAKLMVGPPGDRFEQEADRVADAVMDGQSVQRMCAECEEESSVQRAPIADGQGAADEELEMDGQDRQDSP